MRSVDRRNIRTDRRSAGAQCCQPRKSTAMELSKNKSDIYDAMTNPNLVAFNKSGISKFLIYEYFHV